MQEWVTEYWVEWGFGIIAVVLSAAYKRLAHKVKDDKDEREAWKKGVVSLLHDRLYQSCKYYISKNSIDVEGLDNIRYLYNSYHALGGNGTGTELYNRAKALPIKED